MKANTLPILGFLLLAAIGGAQPAPHRTLSLDARVLNADFVCVCKIVKVDTTRPATQGSNVDVEVTTRIKGEVSQTTQFMISASEEQLDAWRASGAQLLAFNGEVPIDLTDAKLQVVTADMRILHHSEEIVAAAREAVRRHPGVLKIETFARQIPQRLAQTGELRSDTSVLVPVDEDLRKWAESEVVHGPVEERGPAIMALRHFPSDENAALLKSMLTDPATRGYSSWIKSTLDAWGVKA